jgi:hypothetical protein
VADELDGLRETADLGPLVSALLRRGEAALERGAWTQASRDLDEAVRVAVLLAEPELIARARAGAALARRADGRPAPR